MFEYQERRRFFAQIPDGMEDLALDELTDLGAEEVKPVYRGMYFYSDKATLYRINYRARHLTRILAPLLTFRCHSERYLYKRSRQIPWPDILKPDQTFAVLSTVSHSRITHSQYAALCLKDAIADAFREFCGKRPGIDKDDPDARISLHIENDMATISLDTSGGSLHRRGYRQETVEAPMQEMLAAAIVRLIEWDGSRPFYDPMCGSGTLLSEALMDYCRIPSGLLRKRFGFELMPDFDNVLWTTVKKEEDNRMRPLPRGIISGSDISSRAIQASRKNNRLLPYGDRIQLKVMDFKKIEDLSNRIIVTNPPYGIRLGKGEDLGGLYKDMGDFFKQRCKGSTAYVYCGNRDLIRHIGLKPSWKKPLVSGGLDGRLLRLEIY